MSSTSRRGFIKTLGTTAAIASSDPVATLSATEGKKGRGTSFSPKGELKKLSENLFLLEDTCNVYLVRDGNRALLIDFGSGNILDCLPGLGITKVDWILHTHHHRDQCQGDYKAVQRSIPIAVPAHERHLFADAENFWRNRRIFELYYVRNDFNTVTKNIPVASLLRDYSTFRWGNRDILIFPTPGHTLGSISLLMNIDGKKTAFTGDLMHSPGKLVDLWDTQVNYGGCEGIDLGVFSLAQLREQKPALLCPSHGDALPDPDGGIQKTIDRLAEYLRFQTGEKASIFNRGYAVSPHLIAHPLAQSAFYAILSNSGKAMFIDYGSASRTHFKEFELATATNDRMRFVEHSIDDLKSRFGMKSVDVAMPSHMHDDHINGFPYLINQFNTKIWCYENMVDVLENPRGYNLGCILGEAFKVSRSFRDGEHFKWEEYDFEIAHLPGHTEYQMALFVTIDGARVVFSGDAFAGPPDPVSGYLRHKVHFRNHMESDSHIKAIRTLIDHEPNLIAPGHGKPFVANRDALLAKEKEFRRQEELFCALVADPDVNFGLDPSWCSIYPYQISAKPGDPCRAEIRVKNYRKRPMKIEVALVTPGEWQIEPDVVRFEAAPQSQARAEIRLRIPKAWQPPFPRVAIAADVICDGKYLGQITEAVVDIGNLIV